MSLPCHRLAYLLVVVLTVAGCGGKATKAGNEPTSRLIALLGAYSQATSQLGHRPTSEKEFREYLAGNGAAILQSYKIASADELLVSPRDNQPYVVLYGKADPKIGQGVVVYEQTGVDGVRQVGFDLRYVEEVDETRFRELVPTPAKR